jgi:hypothetical protein
VVRRQLEDTGMPVHEAPPDNDDDDDDNDNINDNAGGGGGGGDGGNTNNDNDGRSEQETGNGSETATRGAADTSSTKRREFSERPRQSYNVAPGYYELVYRAMVPDWGAGPNPHAPLQQQQQQQQKDQKEQQSDDASCQKMDAQGEHTQPAATRSSKDQVRYRLQSMKWGMAFLGVFLHPMLFSFSSLSCHHLLSFSRCKKLKGRNIFRLVFLY